jgi:uncharacterized membrane protein YdjX (TVP38/TMEM64 family)
METTPRKTKIQAVISLGLTMVVIVLVVVFISREMEQVRSFIRGSGWIGVLMSIALYALLGFSPVPSEPLTILLGTIYGPFTATIVAGTGNLLAAVMEYMVGRRLSHIASFEERRNRLPFGLGRFPVDSAVFLLVARMLPGYGPKFVSLIAGVYRVPMYRYLWTAAIPTFVGSAIFAYGGFGLLQMIPGYGK